MQRGAGKLNILSASSSSLSNGQLLFEARVKARRRVSAENAAVRGSCLAYAPEISDGLGDSSGAVPSCWSVVCAAAGQPRAGQFAEITASSVLMSSGSGS